MPTPAFSSQDFTRDVSVAKWAAVDGDNHRLISQSEPTLLEVMDGIPGGESIEFNPPRLNFQSHPIHIPNPCSERDALIAATAMEHLFTVVTCNRAAFGNTGVVSVEPRLGWAMNKRGMATYLHEAIAIKNIASCAYSQGNRI